MLLAAMLCSEFILFFWDLGLRGGAEFVSGLADICLLSGGCFNLPSRCEKDNNWRSLNIFELHLGPRPSRLRRL